MQTETRQAVSEGVSDYARRYLSQGVRRRSIAGAADTGAAVLRADARLANRTRSTRCRGGSGKRPERENILRMARCRQVDAILVQALDRWGRSVQDLVLTMAELETLGVAFVVPGHIDMTTPMGRMLAHFLAAVAEFERELIRERLRSGLANAKAKGKPLGRPRAASSRVQKGQVLLDQGKTYQEAIRQMGLSVSTLIRARREKKKLQAEG